jgi:ABC-type amino acid transport system permease subunit
LRVLSSALAGWVGFCIPGALLTWGVFGFSLLRPTVAASWFAGSVSSKIVMICALGIGLVMAFVLARWRWRRSAASDQRRELLVAGCLVVLLILVLMQPEVYPLPESQ